MIYTDFQGEKLSLLGFGAMRLPTVEGDDSRIDEKATFEMVDYALDHGVNYFDTAWGYHGGNSETVLGRALARHDRASFQLATKFPGYDVKNFGKHEQIFERQLEKLQADHIDFYLLHNVCEINIDRYLDEDRYHTVAYFLDQKRAGRIRHLGFSVHGDWDTFERFVERFGDAMEFCQIELNYMDWDFQEANKKVAWCNEHGVPVMVMEPLRGGHLLDLSDAQTASLQALRPGVTPAEWAFRWVQDVPGVAVVLSGMGTMRQLQENIATFGERKPLSEKETAAIARIAHEMATAKGLPCTGCHYCVSHCPMGLDIPLLISLYNEYLTKDGGFIPTMRLSTLADDEQPSRCVRCNACHNVCPQALEIPEFLHAFAHAVGQE